MTAEDTLFAAEMAGITFKVKDGRPFIDCPPGRKPNAALMAAIRENRSGILALLGVADPGTEPEPEMSTIGAHFLEPELEACGTCHALVRPGCGEDIARLCYVAGWSKRQPTCPFKNRSRWAPDDEGYE